jgi:hypothetical protein
MKSLTVLLCALFASVATAQNPGDGIKEGPWQCSVSFVMYYPLDEDSGLLQIWTLFRVPVNTPARIEIQVGEIGDPLEWFRILHSEYVESADVEWHYRYTEAEVGNWIDPHVPLNAGVEVRAMLTDYSSPGHPMLENWKIYLFGK